MATSVLVLWSLNATPNPTKAPYGSTITLVPSLGHEPATVPSIPNTYSYAQAQAALQAVGPRRPRSTQSSTTVASGDVISTSPASGAPAPYGSVVTVNVSTGPPTVYGPQRPAGHGGPGLHRAPGAGLSPSGVSGSPTNNVVGTQPSIGSTVNVGSSVQLFTH